MFGNKSLDSLPKIGMGGDDSEGSDSSSAPVTRAEFDALKAQVNDLQDKMDQDEQDDSAGDDDSSDSMTSTSIAGAAKSTKPTVGAKKMVGMMGGSMRKPPFSS